MTGGEPRNIRRFRPRCRFLLALTRFTRPRYLPRRATSASCPDGVLVAIDVHGSEDQEKDASTADHERDVSAFLVSGACASKSACGRRSLPRRPLDIRCRRCDAERGGAPFPTADRTKAYVPTPSREGRRHPVDRDAFYRCEARRAFDRRIAPPTKSRASVPRSRRPHFVPRVGRVPLRALQAPECGHPRSLAFEEQVPFLPRGRSFRIFRAWD